MLDVGYIGYSPADSWRSIKGGAAYARYIFDVLNPRFNVESMGLRWREEPGNKILKGARLAYKLIKLKGTKDIWIRGFWSTVTLPMDRTKGKNILIIQHIDNTDSSYPLLSKLLNQAFHRSLRQVDVVVTCSNYWKEYFEARGHQNVRVIYNPFEVASFKFTEHEIADFIQRHGLTARPIIYIGNCQRAKGVVEVYEALKDLDMTLVTSGEKGVDIPALNLKLDYRDYLRLLKASSVVVTMSKFKEGWNRTAHEAMLCKTPVVGSGAGGMKELLDGGQQIVCPSFSELRPCVEYALDHPELGEKGYDFARSFTVERFASDWIRLIEELAELLP